MARALRRAGRRHHLRSDDRAVGRSRQARAVAAGRRTDHGVARLDAGPAPGTPGRHDRGRADRCRPDGLWLARRAGFPRRRRTHHRRADPRLSRIGQSDPSPVGATARCFPRPLLASRVVPRRARLRAVRLSAARGWHDPQRGLRLRGRRDVSRRRPRRAVHDAADPARRRRLVRARLCARHRAHRGCQRFQRLPPRGAGDAGLHLAPGRSALHLGGPERARHDRALQLGGSARGLGLYRRTPRRRCNPPVRPEHHDLWRATVKQTAREEGQMALSCKVALWSSAGLLVGIGTPAFAQAGSGHAEASSPADIVVTARRFEERAQDVPISITVFNQDQLSDRNVVTPEDLSLYTPSLSTTGIYGRDSTAYAIRGFTQTMQTSPSVAVYFADVVATRGGGTVAQGDGAGPGSFFDLQNVQVLKGPQGTDLDDRHYIAARASLVWDITPDLENYTILSYVHSKSNGSAFSLLECDPNTFIGSVICGPFATRQQGGPRIASIDRDDSVNERKNYGIINTTTLQASDTLTIKNIVSYSRLKGHYRSDIFGTDFKVPSTVVVPIQDAAGNLLALYPTSSGALAGTRLQFIDVSDAPGTQTTDQSSFTEELQFQGNVGEGKLIWQAGIYYERSDPHGLIGTISTQLTNCSDIANLQCYSPLGQVYRKGYAEFYARATGFPVQFTDPGFDFPIGGVGKRLSDIAYRNFGLYGQATLALTRQLKLTGGIRYTSDKVRSTAKAFTYTFPAANRPVVSCIVPNTTLAQDCRVDARKSSSRPTWLIGLDYKPTDDVLIYAKYARGYRQGSVSANAADGYRTFEPEKVDAYELGLKADIRGAVSGYFNLSAFYNKLTNQQLSALFNTRPGSSISQADGIINAGRSRIYGLEVEASIIPFAGFNLNGSYTYLNTKLISLAPTILPPNSPFFEVIPAADVGGDLIYSPHHRLTIAASYTLPLDESVGQITLGAVYSYTGPQNGAALSASRFAALKGFNTLNLNLNWDRVAGSPIDLALFATNVTNETYVSAVAGLYNSSGFEVARYGEQRIVGAKLRYNF
ncbi:MAG: TonB-dependent receptor [Novosphingobium sp.]|nr:MAG: TonB-dependent receptor [Novosphingobium sp.]